MAAPEVDVSRRQVVQALVVSTVVVVADELLDALFELSWQVVVVQQDPVFHRAMISLDFALRHRVVRPAADMSDAVVLRQGLKQSGYECRLCYPSTDQSMLTCQRGCAPDITLPYTSESPCAQRSAQDTEARNVADCEKPSPVAAASSRELGWKFDSGSPLRHNRISFTTTKRWRFSARKTHLPQKRGRVESYYRGTRLGRSGNCNGPLSSDGLVSKSSRTVPYSGRQICARGSLSPSPSRIDEVPH